MAARARGDSRQPTSSFLDGEDAVGCPRARGGVAASSHGVVRDRSGAVSRPDCRRRCRRRARCPTRRARCSIRSSRSACG
jgi:hypothetical protein